MAAGDPPTAMQMLGLVVQDWAEQGVLGDLTPLAEKDGWDKVIPPALQNIVKYDGHYVAAPFNMHSTNWVWVNKALFDKVGGTEPTTWENFQRAGAEVQGCGRDPGGAWRPGLAGGHDLRRCGDQRRRARVLQEGLHRARRGGAWPATPWPRRSTSCARSAAWSTRTSPAATGTSPPPWSSTARPACRSWATGPRASRQCRQGAGHRRPVLPLPGHAGGGDLQQRRVRHDEGERGRGRTRSSSSRPRSWTRRSRRASTSRRARSRPAATSPTPTSTPAARRRSRTPRRPPRAGALMGSMAHGHAAPEAVKGAVYDVVTEFFNSDMSSADAGKKLGRGGRQREVRSGGAPAQPAPRTSAGRGKMAVAVEQRAVSRPFAGTDWLAEYLPKIVLAPSFVITLFFVYGFILWTTYLSFTKSRLMPVTAFDGLRALRAAVGQQRLVDRAREPRHLQRALHRHRHRSSASLLAILLDQKIRGRGLLRTIYLYPMAISFIVTGTAWKWILNPGIGIEKMVHDWGFDRLPVPVDHRQPAWRSTASSSPPIWQSSGFVMAMFLAGLRGVDSEIIKAAQIDGATPSQDLLADHHPADAAGVPQRLRHPGPPRDQELRPGHRPDQRRPRLGDLACPRSSCTR